MNQILRAPILFHPFFKKVIWGGDKICKWKSLPQQEPNIGESWEISQVSGYDSVVANGEYKGLNLTQLIDRFGKELLGDEIVKKYGKRFPLLIKFIDATHNLSVQVHPDDKLALKRHNDFGKTEMWYIISTEGDAKIYAGVEDLNPDSLAEKLKNNTLLESIRTYDSKKEDVYFLPPGTVHAIGAGNFLLEIQQSSDITYRIFDYNRKDQNGNLRELHIDLAKEAIVYNNSQICLIDNFKESEGGGTVLVESDYFTTTKYVIDSKKTFTIPQDSFRIIICTEGKVNIICEDQNETIKAGDSALIPAYVGNFQLDGKGTVLICKAV